MMNNRLPAMATFLKNGPRLDRLSICTVMVIGIKMSNSTIAAKRCLYPMASKIPPMIMANPESMTESEKKDGLFKKSYTVLPDSLDNIFSGWIK